MNTRESISSTILSDLKDDIFFQHLPMNSDMVAQLNQTSTRFSIFHVDTAIRKTYALIDCVINANYDAVEKIVKKDPALMFRHVNFLYPDGHTECISPLKYAFKVYDTYMWELVLDAIQAYPALQIKFLQQAHEQTEHVNLERFFEACRAYGELAINSSCCYFSDYDSVKSVAEKAWRDIGKQQMALPMHMIKEFCRKGSAWHPESDFDVTRLERPSSTDAFSFECNKERSLLSSDTCLSLLSNGCALSRGTNECAAERRWIDISYEFTLCPDKTNATVDATIVARLLEVRASELVLRISQLEQVEAQRMKMS